MIYSHTLRRMRQRNSPSGNYGKQLFETTFLWCAVAGPCDTTLSTAFDSDLWSVDGYASQFAYLSKSCFSKLFRLFPISNRMDEKHRFAPYAGPRPAASWNFAYRQIVPDTYGNAALPICPQQSRLQTVMRDGHPTLYLLHDFTKYQDREWTLVDGSTTTKSDWFDIKQT